MTNNRGRTQGGDTRNSAVCPMRPSKKLQVRPEFAVRDTALRLGSLSLCCHSGLFLPELLQGLSLLILKMGMMMNH